MSDSILNSTKKMVGLAEDYHAFDLDIITHINSVFSTLTQLGLGPVNGFMIEDAVAIWSDFIGEDDSLNAVKSYMYLRVRLLFDPPTTSFALASFNEQLKEMEWRLNARREMVAWFSPMPIPEGVGDPHGLEDPVIDGGIH